MTALLAGALAAGALVTWAFLRPRGAPRAVPFPSLQLLGASDLKRRRRPRLEDVPGWALRLGALGCLAAALAADALGPPGALAPVVLVAPRAGEAGWAAARQEEAVARLGFDGEAVRAEGPLGPWLAPAARDCSASQARCLGRAAALAGRPVVLVGAADAGWEGLEDVAAPVAWREVALEAARGADAGTASPGGPATRVRRTGTSPEARLWAAALEAAAEAGRAPPEVEVVDAAQLGPATGPRLVVAATPAPARGGWPAVEARQTGGVLLGPGEGGLWLEAPLGFGAGEGVAPVAGAVLVARRGAGPPEVAAAATAEELGRWAHRGPLPALARAALEALAPRPVLAAGLPPPGPVPFLGPDGAPAPLGVLDVAPGEYRRADGEVRALVARAEAGAPGPAPLGALPGAGWPWPAALLGLSAALLLAALARTRTLPSAAVGLVALALLGGLALDVEREVTLAPRTVVRLAGDAGPTAAALRAAGLEVAPGEEALPCEAPRHPAPCRVVAVLGAASAPPARANGLVFEPGAPRVDVLSVRGPAAVALGEAALVEAVVRVRRAPGATVGVTARPAHGAPVARTLEVPDGGADAVLGVALPVAPLLAGPEAVVVEASVDGGAADALALSLEVRPAPPRRVLLAGAPSWEARFAPQALERGAGQRPAGLTRVGATAALAAGLPAQEPRRWLASPGALDGVATVLLTGFTARELAGAPAAALEAHLGRGGAVVLLGGEGAEALGWPPVAALEGPTRRLAADLRDGAPALEAEAPSPGPAAGPPGAEVLATLGGQPWMLGRAQGAGRVVVVRSADLFRLSPPAGEGEAAERALLRVLAWAEARPPAGPAPAAAVAALPRARLRAEAARRGTPWLELDGPREAAQVLGALPPPAPRPYPLPLRRDAMAAGAALALLAVEALSRRLRRPVPAA